MFPLVGDNVKKLEKQFSSLRKRFTSELEKNDEGSLEELLDSLTFLPIELRAEYSTSVVAKKEIFEQGECNIRKIFRHLKDLLSFIDYRLLQFLIEEFGSEPLQKDMSAYAKDVEVFLDETTVQQLMDQWPAGRQEIPQNFEKIETVIGKDPSAYTLRELDNLRRRFCCESRLYEIVFILIRVGRSNSFIVSWAVPSIFVSQLKSVIGSLSYFYKAESILSVTVGKQQLYSITVSNGLLQLMKYRLGCRGKERENTRNTLLCA